MTRLVEVCWLHDGCFQLPNDGTDNSYTAVVLALPDRKSAMCEMLTVKYGSNTAVSGVRSWLGKSIKNEVKSNRQFLF